MLSRKEFFIGGTWQPPTGDGVLQVINPRTEEVSGEVPIASSVDVDSAVMAARDAFDGPWQSLPFEERIVVLERARDGLARRADLIANAIEAEQGIPAATARAGLVPAILRMIDVAIDSGRQVAMVEVRRDSQGAVVVQQEPKGVVSALVPFNGPLPIAVLKCAPALLAGCPVVLKASDLTPLTVFYLAEAFEEAGLAQGMLNVIAGDARTGQAMVEHSQVDMISFTGSTAVGRRIAEVAGGHLKNLSLELGGKSAAIVLEDADISTVAQVVGGGTYANTGQYCRALTRTLAPRSRYEEVVEALAGVARSMTPGERMGPLISALQRDRVDSFVKSALDEGARLVTGGRRPDRPEKGYYYEATVFAEATNAMRFVREEIFGPVIAVIPYDTVDEAVAIANDSEFGLSGAVFTEDFRAGLDIARRVRTGTTGINLHGARSCAPCGGMKSSGIGQEHGPEGFLEFLTPKAILVPEELAVELEESGVPSRPTIR